MYELLPSGLQIFPIYLQTLGNILTTIVWLYSIFEFKRRTPIKKKSIVRNAHDIGCACHS